jgi:pimeloyl-ACP methyl ester carboxylesterase
MYRIRNKLVANMQKGQAPAILLQHGLFSSSDTWITNFANKAPAFVFANNGYDVWLGNSRGNKYSRIPGRLDPDLQNKEFYDFSF